VIRRRLSDSAQKGSEMLNYNPQGLIPAVIQDDDTNDVLMLGYMNPETLQLTKERGQVVFWSRSRQEIWHKGATSGDYLEVRSIKADCENNSLLVRVKMLGKAVCHTGARSCFFNDVDELAAPTG
jgi:phosphoribosyl-AMP cyclohydrolase